MGEENRVEAEPSLLLAPLPPSTHPLRLQKGTLLLNINSTLNTEQPPDIEYPLHLTLYIAEVKPTSTEIRTATSPGGDLASLPNLERETAANAEADILLLPAEPLHRRREAHQQQEPTTTSFCRRSSATYNRSKKHLPTPKSTHCC